MPWNGWRVRTCTSQMLVRVVVAVARELEKELIGDSLLPSSYCSQSLQVVTQLILRITPKGVF